MPFTYTITANDWMHIAPVLSLLIVTLLVMVIDVMLPARQRGLLVIVALLGIASAFASTLMLYQATGGAGATAFYDMVSSDNLSLLATLIILVAATLALLFSPGYIERQGVRQQGEYYALVLLAVTGMVLLASATNLMTVFLGIELLSLPLYVLCAFAPGQLRAYEAGMKYFLLSSFASAFLLYGMALVYGATGATGLAAIHAFVTSHALNMTSGYGPLLLAGMALLAVGLTFKVSAIPFHAWTPDVYEGAPTPVTALMSVGTKTAAFIALIRIFPLALGSLVQSWQGIFWGLAIITMIGGNLLAASQTNVKRLLAYSSIAHAGYLLIGLTIGTSLGIAAMLVYLAAYAVMNVGAFGVVLVLERSIGLGTSLEEYRGLGTRQPLLAGALALFLFALAGFPGTVGFIGKYTVFAAAVQAGHSELTVIGVVASILGFYYYLRVIWAMYFTAAPTNAATTTTIAAPTTVSGTGIATASVSGVLAVSRPIASNVAIGLGLAVIATLLLGIVPGPLVDLARQAAGLP